MTLSLSSVGIQAGLALAYYLAVIAMVRLAGKRLAGQVTSFDLVVLITLTVVMQELVLEEGKLNAAVFIITILLVHRTLAHLESRSSRLREFLRGKPRTLIVDGRVLPEARRRKNERG